MKFEKIRMAVDDLFGVAIATERILTDSPDLLRGAARGRASPRSSPRSCSRSASTARASGSTWASSTPPASSRSRARAPGRSIEGADILKARRRCWRYGEAIWLANHDTYEDLAKAHISGTNGDVFLFSPARGEDVPDMLLGRPVFFTEFAETKGTKGDLILGNWSQYLEAVYQTDAARGVDPRAVPRARAGLQVLDPQRRRPLVERRAHARRRAPTTLSPFVDHRDVAREPPNPRRRHPMGVSVQARTASSRTTR